MRLRLGLGSGRTRTREDPASLSTFVGIRIHGPAYVRIHRKWRAPLSLINSSNVAMQTAAICSLSSLLTPRSYSNAHFKWRTSYGSYSGRM